MIKLNKINEYLNAIKIGFDYFGLNGLYEVHKDVCDKKSYPWKHDLENLNDLEYKEFELLCSVYLKANKN